VSKRGLLPFVLALGATVALVATVRWVSIDRSPGPPGRTVSHLYDLGEGDHAWFTVTGTFAAPHVLGVRFGPWEQAVKRSGTDPVTYTFTYRDLPEGTPQVLDVYLPTGGSVAFGQGGAAPEGAVSIDDAWVFAASPVTAP
jgi:hypothetical protein